MRSLVISDHISQVAAQRVRRASRAISANFTKPKVKRNNN